MNIDLGNFSRRFSLLALKKPMAIAAYINGKLRNMDLVGGLLNRVIRSKIGFFRLKLKHLSRYLAANDYKSAAARKIFLLGSMK